MPTARELLEQADALMRRNRQDAAQPARAAASRAGAPVFTIGPVPSAADVPAPVPPGPRPAAAAPETDIPVLDEIVAAPPPAEADDEFPVLTDAIDEIDVATPPSIDPEPSDWLEAPFDDQSVLGPAPPSVALVPAVSIAPARAPSAPAHAAMIAPPPAPDLEDFDLAGATPDVPPITVVRAPLPATLPSAPPSSAPPSSAPPPATWLEELVTAPPPLDEGATITPAGALLAPAVVEPTPVADPMPSGGTVPIESDRPPVASVAPAVVNAAPPRDESWDALAEEIRMQVLQRIDLFTDTGLRERLGERLKPIVDRASADLVATINQHVGELLRAYVAEAIEREIDRWRSGR